MEGNFPAAVKIVLLHEGGYVNDPNDHGGETNFGITQATLGLALGDPRLSGLPALVKDLTVANAQAIYWVRYWGENHLDMIDSPPLAMVLLDQIVLNGAVPVVEKLQALLGVKPDGVMGPMTLTAANREGGDTLAFKLIRLLHHRYTSIVTHDASQAKFLGGWTDRLFSLLDFVFFGDAT